MSIFTHKSAPYIVYGLMTLGILGLLLLPGYILTLDMVFVPHPPLPAQLSNAYLFEVVLHYASLIIPGDIIQKVILAAFFFFAAFGAHRLIAYIGMWVPNPPQSAHIVTAFKPHVWQWAAYCAGLFYVINPYVYGRFMAGQYLVLLGYMMLPLFMRALLEFLDKPTLKRTLPVTIFALILSIMSIHTIGLAMLLAIVAVLTVAWQQRHDRSHMLAMLKYSALSLGATVLLSAYWLIPLMLGNSAAAQAISSFDDAHMAAFATDGGLFSVLMLKGFWVEAQGLFTRAEDVLPLSGLVQLGVWALIIAGVVYAWRTVRPIAIMLSVTAGIAITCALSQPVMQWLAANVPLLAGYREPHKFVAVVALAFSVFFAFGAAIALQKMAHYKKPALYYAAAIVLVLVPLLNTPTMARSFNGQLSPRQYPADWHTVNERLNQDTQDFKTLFLPWHLYLSFDFAGRIVANPADKFFDKPIIVSENLEFANVPSSTLDATKYTIETEILPHAAASTTLGERLAPLGIKYVLLAKDTDNPPDYLDRQTDLELVSETETLKLYRNTAFGAGHASD